MKLSPIFLSVPLSFFFTFVSCKINHNQLVDKIYDGYIIEDIHQENAFYLQDLEGGELVQLKFEYEDLDLLSFDEFGYVEVFGQYNTRGNYLVVERINTIHLASPIIEDYAFERP